MLLGHLLCDIPAAEVYQLHREPPNWRWQNDPDSFDYVIEEPALKIGTPALVLSLSATIVDDRIRAVLADTETTKLTGALMHLPMSGYAKIGIESVQS